ncbi:Oidioi.mRNA.OKI2018_I69.chr2.g6080.t1.cds [Oikopleura dioica]|uniref:DNA polymerase epsilon subunit 3 n=1 Tax=Oikopleura dioica TaxID=34765 RepID=A0ABN7T444_OIKDI|nr:Oidioi.mRNA.OKI2018_I69.chr2.g6080.t1.cds [Oikopleura dioica]
MSDKVEDLSLPNAVVARIIKEALPPGSIVAKDAKLAIAKATSLFIVYLSQTATEVASNNKRKTLKESDIIDALSETEFDDLVPLVKSELEAAKVKKANKAKEKKEKKAEEEKGENEAEEEAGGEVNTEADKENAEQKNNEDEMES